MTAFEKISCPVCENTEYKPVLVLTPDEFLSETRKEYYDLESIGIDFNTPFTVVKCKKCSFVFVNPRLKKEYNVMAYNVGKTKKYSLHGDEYEDIHNVKDEKKLKQKRVYTEELLALFSMGKRDAVVFLDYGCGFGFSMIIARAMGMDCYGVDIDQYRLESCSRYGLKVSTPELFDMDFPGIRADFILSQNVLEHVTDLNEYLDFIRKHSREGTLVRVNGLTPAVIKKEKRAGKYKLVNPIEHLNYFTLNSLDYLFSKYGFKPIRYPFVIVSNVPRSLILKLGYSYIGHLFFNIVPVFIRTFVQTRNI